MYAAAWGGLPSKEFLARLDPQLAALRDRLFDEAHSLDRPAGPCAPTWASAARAARGHPDRDGRLRRPLRRRGRRRADRHAREDHRHVHLRLRGRPAAASAARRAGHLRHRARLDHARLPRHRGRAVGGGRHLELVGRGRLRGRRRPARASSRRKRQRLRPGESGLVALDWNNGNRTILVDPRLTRPRARPDAAHDARRDLPRAHRGDRVRRARDRRAPREYGVAVERVVCCGGIAEKNDLFMQIYADVLGRPMLVAGSAQTPALGSAVSAAVAAGEAAGGHARFEQAQAAHDALAAQAASIPTRRPRARLRRALRLLPRAARQLRRRARSEGRPRHADEAAARVPRARPRIEAGLDGESPGCATPSTRRTWSWPEAASCSGPSATSPAWTAPPGSS